MPDPDCEVLKNWSDFFVGGCLIGEMQEKPDAPAAATTVVVDELLC